MTEKERKMLKKMDKDSKKSMYQQMGKMIGKELEQYFCKKGFDVSRDNFFVKTSGCKTPPSLKFAVGGEIIATYLYEGTESIKEWKKNDLSFFKTFKKNNEAGTFHSRVSNTTFKDFLKEVKSYCKKNEMFLEKRDKANDMSTKSKEELEEPSERSEEELENPSERNEEEIENPSERSEEEIENPSERSEEEIENPSERSEEEIGEEMDDR